MKAADVLTLILRIPLVAENSLALWLLIFGVNEAEMAGSRLRRSPAHGSS